MILLIDNYDSFVYNLYQYIGTLNPDVRVVRNDEVTVDEVIKAAPSHLILSPGPGKPQDAGICQDIISALAPTTPILGVCLGHQAICEALGGTVGYAKTLMHGKTSRISLDPTDPLFAGLPSEIKVARYHSLAAEADTLPEELIVSATTDDGEVMAIRHARYPLHGVQFHPESIMSPDGMQILKNFLALENPSA